MQNILELIPLKSLLGQSSSVGMRLALRKSGEQRLSDGVQGKFRGAVSLFERAKGRKGIDSNSLGSVSAPAVRRGIIEQTWFEAER